MDFVALITLEQPREFLRVLQPLAKAMDTVFKSEVNGITTFALYIPSSKTIFRVAVRPDEVEGFEEQLKGIGFVAYSASIEFQRP